MPDAAADFVLLTVVPDEHVISELENYRKSGNIPCRTDAASVFDAVDAGHHRSMNAGY